MSGKWCPYGQKSLPKCNGCPFHRLWHAQSFVLQPLRLLFVILTAPVNRRQQQGKASAECLHHRGTAAGMLNVARVAVTMSRQSP